MEYIGKITEKYRKKVVKPEIPIAQAYSFKSMSIGTEHTSKSYRSLLYSAVKLLHATITAAYS